jgi:hypothetical protein
LIRIHRGLNRHLSFGVFLGLPFLDRRFISLLAAEKSVLDKDNLKEAGAGLEFGFGWMRRVCRLIETLAHQALTWRGLPQEITIDVHYFAHWFCQCVELL